MPLLSGFVTMLIRQHTFTVTRAHRPVKRPPPAAHMVPHGTSLFRRGATLGRMPPYARDLRRRLRALGPDDLARLRRTLDRAAREVEFTYDDDGRTKLIPLLVAPAILSR